MGNADAIANVGLTLIEILRTGLPDTVPDSDVELMSPADVGSEGSVRLTLHLFGVEINEHMRNAEVPAEDGTVASTHPLRLDLRYLLTAYPSDVEDDTANTEDQHKVLGQAMQTMREHAVVPGPMLRGPFDDNESIHVSILPESTDAAVNVWNTFDDEPYRPSVGYLVTPVIVESTREEPIERVVEREVAQYAPGGSDE